MGGEGGVMVKITDYVDGEVLGGAWWGKYLLLMRPIQFENQSTLARSCHFEKIF